MMDTSLQEAIQQLHCDVGSPSTRTIAEGVGISHSTVARILRGYPSAWHSLHSVVTYLGGDPKDFEQYCSPTPGGLIRLPTAQPVQDAMLSEMRITNELLRELVHLVRTPPETE